MAIKHVLFDNDGTIVDSEIVGARIMLNLLARHGLHLEERAYNVRFPGLLTRDILVALREEEGFDAPADFMQQIKDAFKKDFHHSIRAVQGMPEVFKSLKVPKSMVSNASSQGVLKGLKKLNLIQNLDGLVFSAEMVEKPKPHPDLYLFAMEILGLLPHESLVVEDSVTGVLAAKSAGIQTIGFLGASHIEDEQGQKLRDAGADLIAANAEGLTEILRKFGVI
ncbi:MAG: HAD family hydrolase [Saprospiraceae bacterium]